ncbi:MAG: hypothetical protein ISR65_19420 [Bacteriovoracaceae bacterium]|nr:hypothetical protein [Bacteriovoracaceae bacterium]
MKKTKSSSFEYLTRPGKIILCTCSLLLFDALLALFGKGFIFIKLLDFV